MEAIGKRWREPDAGIWELDNRNGAQPLTCVGGIRSICAAGAPGSRIGPWTALADAILAGTARFSVHPSGRWQRAPDDERVDAALLLPPLAGGHASDDPRTRVDLSGGKGHPRRQDFVYRFKPDERPLGEAEGAFQLCAFALSLAAPSSSISSRRPGPSSGAARPAVPRAFSPRIRRPARQLRGNFLKPSSTPSSWKPPPPWAGRWRRAADDGRPADRAGLLAFSGRQLCRPKQSRTSAPDHKVMVR